MKSFVLAQLCLLCHLFVISAIGQVPVDEPTNYDWRLSFDQTTTTEVFYDKDVLKVIPNDAQFWIDIQSNETKVRRTSIAKGGVSIYERFTTLESRVNGEEFTHGLYDMIKTKKTIYTSSQFEPDFYTENLNAQTFDYSQKVENIVNPEFSLRTIKQQLENSEWETYKEDGTTWYQNLDYGIIMTVDPKNGIMTTIYLEDETEVTQNFSEVGENIWRVVSEVITFQKETIEGFCIEERMTTINENYSIDIRQSEDQSGSRTNQRRRIDIPNDVKISQDGSQLFFQFADPSDHSGFSISLFDVSGRLISTSTLNSNSSIDVKQGLTGIYLIQVSSPSFQAIQKVFIK